MDEGISMQDDVSLEEPVHLNDAGGGVVLRLVVTDPEVVVELRRQGNDQGRQRFALAALRVGVMSLKTAAGTVDGQAIRDAGDHLLSGVRELLASRAAEVSGQIAGTLSRYFDPTTGSVPQRLEALTKKDGDLDRVLRTQLGSEDSTLAKSLAAHLGERSPLLKMLSPTEAGGLRAQLAHTVEAALNEQRLVVLKEFSLDAKESALSRLLAEISERHGELRTDMKGQLSELVGEFTLDRPESALSRLVARVDMAQKAIAEQFSTDSKGSAINRLSELLTATGEQIGRSLTLDDEASPLSVLRRELKGSVDELLKRNAEFQTEVKETLASLQARRQEASRSTRHGATFEDEFGLLLAAEAQRLGDVFEATGQAVGVIKNCKTGDHVIHLGPDSAAPGARIAWEAKEDRSYDVKSALVEMETARKNRSSQIGVFVFSKATAPIDLAPFTRYGSDLVVVWDADDQATDLVVRAALSVARALVVRDAAVSDQSKVVLRDIETLNRAVEKQMGQLDQVKTWADTIQTNGAKISERATKMKAELEKSVDELDRCVAALKTTDLAA